MPADEGWTALAQHIARARKLGRFRTRAEFASWLGISERTLDHLDAAQRTGYSRDVAAAVEIGLGWTPGSFDAVSAGGEPTYADDVEFERLRMVWTRLSPDARRMLLYVAEQAANGA